MWRFMTDRKGRFRGNIIGESKVGFLFSLDSRTNLSFNALYSNHDEYVLDGSREAPSPDRRGNTDLKTAPSFVNPDQDDYRLQADTALARVGGFPFLGALPPVEGHP